MGGLLTNSRDSTDQAEAAPEHKLQSDSRKILNLKGDTFLPTCGLSVSHCTTTTRGARGPNDRRGILKYTFTRVQGKIAPHAHVSLAAGVRTWSSSRCIVGSVVSF